MPFQLDHANLQTVGEGGIDYWVKKGLNKV